MSGYGYDPIEIAPTRDYDDEDGMMQRKVDDLREREQARVDRWYDRNTRSWVVQLKNALGDQIGDADYVATRAEADRIVADHAARLHREHQARIDRGEECPGCGGRGRIERTAVITPLFFCRECGTSWFDLIGDGAAS